jgi:hypothetical protein
VIGSGAALLGMGGVAPRTDRDGYSDQNIKIQFVRDATMKIKTASIGGAGGVRLGSGRPKGSKNRSTLEREAKIQKAVDAVLKELGKEGLAKLEPITILLTGMRLLFAAGDLSAALVAAERAAVYVHVRPGTALPTPPVPPPELLADPPPCPDEPGPADAE